MVVISFLGDILGKAMSFIFNIVGNYGLSIIIFTLLTKVILFPLNMATQKNSINMVRLMPEENALKIKYIDDKDKLGEEQLKLYKKYHYHPLLSSVPLLIQIPLVLGLVYVMYHPLTFIHQFDTSIIDQFKDWLALFSNEEALKENNYQLEIEQFGRVIEQGEEPRVSEAFTLANARTMERILRVAGYYAD